MIGHCTELAREWSILVYIAQLDLKKASDCISHDSIAEMFMSQKPQSTTCGCALQLMVLQFCGSPFGTCYFRSLHPCGQEGCRREFESPLVFVMVADEILGVGLDKTHSLWWGENRMLYGNGSWSLLGP